MNKIIIIILNILIFQSCINNSFKISDYTVYPIGEFGNGCYITCADNMSCKGDAFIENIKSIQWDKRHIIVEQQENGKTNWYMIIARGEELKCCNWDTTIGPVTNAEISSLIKSENIDIQKLNQKIFVK